MDKEYKTSRYNFLLETDDEKYLLYNSKSGAFAATPISIKDKIGKLLSNPSSDCDENIKKELIAGSFLIESNVNEIEEMRKLHKERKAKKDILTLTIMPSERCNFRCPYCFEHERRNLDMQDGVYDALLNLIKKSIVPNFKLNIGWFGGEPTLAHKKIVGFMGKVNQISKENKFSHTSYSMITNGYLLTPNLFKQYLDLGLKMFQITVDGDENQHNLTRYLANGKGTFKTIWKNLLALKSINGNFSITVRCNYLKGKDQELQAFMDKFHAEFGDDKRFSLYFYAVFGHSTKRNESCSFADDLLTMEEGFFKSNEYSYHLAKIMEIADKDKQQVAALPIPRSIYCATPTDTLWVVGADGLLFKCDQFAGSKEFACGQLNPDGSIDKFDNNLNFWITTPYDTNDKKCLDCKLLPICQGGCAGFQKSLGKGCYCTEDHIYTLMLNSHKLQSGNYQKFERVSSPIAA